MIKSDAATFYLKHELEKASLTEIQNIGIPIPNNGHISADIDARVTN